MHIGAIQTLGPQNGKAALNPWKFQGPGHKLDVLREPNLAYAEHTPTAPLPLVSTKRNALITGKCKEGLLSHARRAEESTPFALSNDWVDCCNTTVVSLVACGGFIVGCVRKARGRPLFGELSESIKNEGEGVGPLNCYPPERGLSTGVCKR